MGRFPRRNRLQRGRSAYTGVIVVDLAIAAVLAVIAVRALRATRQAP